MEPKTLYILAPCYNEAEVLPLTSKIFLDKLNSLITEGKISENSRVAFVDDGSKDETWNIIESLHELDPKFIGVKLSRNRGHQNALLGGMSTVADDCDMIVTIDADAQDDVNAIDKMSMISTAAPRLFTAFVPPVKPTHFSSVPRHRDFINL